MGWDDDLLDRASKELRSQLARLQSLDLWPPWDAVQTIIDVGRAVVRIATTPPAPDPEDIDDAATAWHKIATDSRNATRSIGTARTQLTVERWEGPSGDSVRSSLTNLEARAGTVPDAADDVQQALADLSTAMTAARKRHADAFDEVTEQFTFDLSHLNPFELKDRITGIVSGAINAVVDLIGAYDDAAEAVQVAITAVHTAMDTIDLPDHLPERGGVRAIDYVNAWSDDGPLGDAVADRFDTAYDKLSPADRAEVDEALAHAGPDALPWILAGVAGGLTGAALARYLDKVRSLPDPGVLDPLRHDTDDFTQPDPTTCGSSSLVMSRMLNDPAYAMWMMTGYDPATGVQDPRSVADRFADEALAMHDRTNGITDRDGDLQLPWPEAVGTQPWALANEMSADGGSGVPGTTYEVRAVDPKDADRAWNEVVTAVEDGHTVPMYVGNDTYPGHIVLVTEATGDTITYYDPSGTQTTVDRDDFVTSNLPGSQENPWAVVVPR